ncbi:MAG: sensor histidine kinase, partial [Methylocystis sp.]
DNHASGDLLSLLQSILAQKEELFIERLGSLDCESNNQKIRNIRGSILQTLSSIDDYVQSSQSQASIDGFVLSNVEINELIAECVALTQSLARQKKVVMRLALVSETIFIRLHVPSLRRALLKILTNAVQFNMPGGQVIVSTAISNHQTFSIKIKDTGVGMSEDEVTTALDSLNRSNETSQPSGRNIYLTDGEKLITQTFASFSIASEKKQGTLITIDFPLSNLSAAE